MLIGENGTGKSNVFDAIMFVLGRKPSELRAKRFADLIYRASDVDKAVVIIDLDYVLPSQADQTPQFKDKPIKVTRWVSKSGSHGYLLNGRETAFEQVAGTLLELGLDLKIRHNIIAQHMITSYASLKPKGEKSSEMGFCEMFERAIGINHRENRKKELEMSVRQRGAEAEGIRS